MVQLLDNDILTREVLQWNGIHLFHFPSSACSQKTRIVLNLKGADWTSHVISLPNNENYEPYYLGINPRGLVPTLVWDGEVHIESNDIITLIDERLDGDKLIPPGMAGRVGEMLHHEDDLHLDLRTLTFRFTQPRGRAPKSKEALAKYRSGGSGTVAGKPNSSRPVQLAFWETAAREGITDAAVRASVGRFRNALSDIDVTLASQPFLLGEKLSLLDVAWFIYVNRLNLCGYPMQRLHPNVASWFERLRQEDAFASQIEVPPETRAAIDANHAQQKAEGATLAQVAGL